MLILMSVAIVIPNPLQGETHDRVRFMFAGIHFEVVEMFSVGSI